MQVNYNMLSVESISGFRIERQWSQLLISLKALQYVCKRYNLRNWQEQGYLLCHLIWKHSVANSLSEYSIHTKIMILNAADHDLGVICVWGIFLVISMNCPYLSTIQFKILKSRFSCVHFHCHFSMEVHKCIRMTSREPFRWTLRWFHDIFEMRNSVLLPVNMIAMLMKWANSYSQCLLNTFSSHVADLYLKRSMQSSILDGF